MVRGRHLVRANVSAGRAWSLVVLAEVGDNGEDAFVALGGPSSGRRRRSWSTPRPLAISPRPSRPARPRSRAGGSESTPRSPCSPASRPTPTPSTRWAGTPGIRWRRRSAPVFEQTGMETRGLRTTALGGLRYSFENGNDLRVEYLFDEAGWTDDQLALAEQAAAASLLTTGDRSGLDPFLAPGFELLGRHLLYASLSLPDLPPQRADADPGPVPALADRRLGRRLRHWELRRHGLGRSVRFTLGDPRPRRRRALAPDARNLRRRRDGQLVTSLRRLRCPKR